MLTRRANRGWSSGVAMLAMFCSVACDSEPPSKGIEARYDEQTGVLRELHADADGNGVTDSWTFMEGTRVVRIEIDKNQDGRIERWEHYGKDGTLEKVGFSRADDGKADAWAFEGADGGVARVEVSLRRDGRVDRWEHHRNGQLVRAEEDSDRNGRPDKWETFEAERLATVAFDEDGDGKSDRRLSYGADGVLLLIESEPGPNGEYRRRVIPKRASGPK